MSMAKRGGARPNAGRKSNKELAEFRSLFDKVLSGTRQRAILLRIAAIAEKGTNESAAVRAAALLWSYRYGLPSVAVGGDSDLPPIEIVHRVVVSG